jgi:hypothetical protein
MPWIFGGLALYIVLAIALGTLTFRRGHIALFAVGFVFPVLWLIGAVIAPAPGHGTGRPSSTPKGPQHRGRVTTNRK